jgi:anthraniloyl-CoA monooxygenase
MKIACIGGGPASLYFAVLLKKRLPGVEIDVYEQNKPDDTFGWGVVFSDETLGKFEEADPESMARIRENFAYWTDIDTFYRGAKVTSTGHGFCGLARRKLLQLLHERCQELGVRLHFQTPVVDIDQCVATHDLVLAADGVNSQACANVTRRRSSRNLDWRKCKFAWFGTTKPMTAFTFVFQPTEWGCSRCTPIRSRRVAARGSSNAARRRGGAPGSTSSTKRSQRPSARSCSPNIWLARSC